MSYRKEAHKLRLMEQGLPEWQAEMIATEREMGGMAGAIADTRRVNVHCGGGMLPERGHTARERAEVDERQRAREAQEARWEEDRQRAQAARDAWNQRR